MPRLANKVAIVTGAAHGIGRAIAERFASLGAHTILADLDANVGEQVAAQLRSTNLRATFVKCDVSNVADVNRVITAALAPAGRLDVVVNNAAYITDWHNILDASPDEWDRCYTVTLLGANHFIKAALPHMLPHRAGSIINVSSVQGLVAARSSPAYTAIKHALVGLTRNVAYDFGHTNSATEIPSNAATRCWLLRLGAVPPGFSHCCTAPRLTPTASANCCSLIPRFRRPSRISRWLLMAEDYCWRSIEVQSLIGVLAGESSAHR